MNQNQICQVLTAHFGSATKREWRVLADHWLQKAVFSTRRRKWNYRVFGHVDKHGTAYRGVFGRAVVNDAQSLVKAFYRASSSDAQTIEHPLAASSRASVKHSRSHTVSFARASSAASPPLSARSLSGLLFAQTSFHCARVTTQTLKYC